MSDASPLTSDLSPFERWRHVVVEGPIGVGKTSLATRLADRFGAQRLLEDAHANPFLARYWRDAARYALPAQLSFLFQRADQLRELTQGALAGRAVVGDFLMEKDALFAQLTLDDEELALYRRVRDGLRPPTPVPDLVIYLQAEPDTLVERVQSRGDPIEAPITERFLRAVSEAYSRFFHEYDAAPLLIVNTERLNPVASDEDLALLLRHAQQMRGRREFFGRG